MGPTELPLNGVLGRSSGIHREFIAFRYRRQRPAGRGKVGVKNPPVILIVIPSDTACTYSHLGDEKRLSTKAEFRFTEF
jgi:hypothetical protein